MKHSFYKQSIFSIVHAGTASFKCMWCFSKFRERDSLDRHSLNCLNELCSYCGISKHEFDDNKLYMEHFKKHVNENNSCDMCSKSFATETILRDHKRKTHVDQVECPQCNELFSNAEMSLLT